VDRVNLAAKLATFGDHWQPRTVARFNDCEHRPVATEEVHLLLIEPAGTPNTGDAATAGDQ
jgi:hypothetical protein